MFSLTHQERKVLIFIGFLVLAGSLLRFRNLNAVQETSFSNQGRIIVSRNILSDELISINSASAETLRSIPGIGEVIARRIIDYRNQFGSFEDLEDLKRVNGIGDKKIEIIKRYITFQ